MRISFSVLLFACLFDPLWAQVGINNPNPKSSFEVRKLNQLVSENVSIPEGIMVPQFTGDELGAKTATGPTLLSMTYGPDQEGALVYVSTPPIQYLDYEGMANVLDKGYYYWSWDKNLGLGEWLKLALDDPSSSSSSSWLSWQTTGNEGSQGVLDSLGFFVGTRDSAELSFRLNTDLADKNVFDRGLNDYENQWITGPGLAPSFVYHGELMRLHQDPWMPTKEFGYLTMGMIYFGHGGQNRSQKVGSFDTYLALTNLAIGPGALSKLCFSPVGLNSDNVVIGYNALTNSPSASTSTVIGSHAMEGFNPTAGNASDNTVVGATAAQFVRDFSASTVLGIGAAKYADNAKRTIFIGDHSGEYNGGNLNIFIGSHAGRSTTNVTTAASSNIVLGSNAGDAITGNGNVVIGSLANLTSGQNNRVLIGTGGNGVMPAGAIQATGNEIVRMAANGVGDGFSNIINTGGTTNGGAILSFQNTNGVAITMGYIDNWDMNLQDVFNPRGAMARYKNGNGDGTGLLDGTFVLDVNGDSHFNNDLFVENSIYSAALTIAQDKLAPEDLMVVADGTTGQLKVLSGAPVSATVQEVTSTTGGVRIDLPVAYVDILDGLASPGFSIVFVGGSPELGQQVIIYNGTGVVSGLIGNTSIGSGEVVKFIFTSNGWRKLA